MRRILSIFLLIFSLFLLGGCSSNMQEKLMADYSFGHQSFGTGNSRITMFMPFAIGQSKGEPWMSVFANKIYQNVQFQGSDSRISIIVMGEKKEKDSLNLDEMAKNATNNLKYSASIKNFKSSIEKVKISGVEARKISMTYDQNEYKLGVIQYIFFDKDVLWEVIYLYKTNEPESVALVDYVVGKIQINE